MYVFCDDPNDPSKQALFITSYLHGTVYRIRANERHLIMKPIEKIKLNLQDIEDFKTERVQDQTDILKKL